MSNIILAYPEGDKTGSPFLIQLYEMPGAFIILLFATTQGIHK